MASQDIITRQLCMAADVEQYSRMDTLLQERTQKELAGVLERAASLSALDRTSWSRQPQGDQEFAVLPAGAPEPVLLGEFVRNLVTALGECNAHRPRKEPMRLRLAVDVGVTRPAALGHSGATPVAVARLLNAAPLKSVLRATRTTNLAVIVSDRLYQDVIQLRSHGLDPSQYVKVRVQHDAFDSHGWIRVPEHDIDEIFGLGPGGRTSAGPANLRREDSIMTAPEEIAALAGTAVVGAMATDAWEFVRDRCAVLFRRHVPQESERLLDQLAGIEQALTAVDPGRRDQVAGALAGPVTSAMADIAAGSREGAADVRALAEVARSTANGARPNKVIYVRDVKARGDVTVSGRDTNVYRGGRR
jgi:hypothetical protein